ncbi:isochorismatase family protein [Acinetobacter sp. V117_2]|uniref:isochorismatase family protein n=1 Tax=Acinetobacter sp. V117_2 TaxID=3072989 RepID=UPI00287CB31B|nr:isochorismatase family protein [Acinetobacter sp. V117_2]MDS7968333.1 isochorismatase family protein [Acinetobacter sp. V117_2]
MKILIQNNSVNALIVVDVQKAFVLGNEAVPAAEQLLSSINILLSKARLARAPVIFLQNDGALDTVDEPFQWGWELFFPPQQGEIVLRKVNDNGFDGTPLQQILNESRVQTFAICGVLSEMCVAATARAALELGYGVLLPHDAHATYNVPAGPGSEEVPAAMAARAAEWSLGDEVVICASSHEVNFIENVK